MPVQRGAPEYVDSNRMGRPPEVPIIAASQFKESPTHDHHRFMQAIEEKVIPPFFGGDEKPDSTTLAFPIDYRPADGGVCPDRCYVRGPSAGIEKVVSGLCARQVETVGMSEEAFDPFERPVARSRCPADVVPGSKWQFMCPVVGPRFVCGCKKSCI